MDMLLLLLLLILIFSSILTSTIFLRAKQQKPRRRPPGPKGLPFIGNLHQFDFSNPHIWLTKLSNKYGPITFLKLCRHPAVVISSAETAKHALKQNDVAFAGRPYSSASLRFSYDQSDIITTAYSDYWRRMRKMVVHHLFSSQKIQSFRPIRADEVSRLIADVAGKAGSGQLIDVAEMAFSFTCNHLCRVAFGKKLDLGAAGPWRRFEGIVSRLLALVTETFVADCLVYGWINKLSGADGRVERVFEEMDSFYQELIDEHLGPNRPESMTNDILDLLIQLREDESAPVKIDWKHIKAILMNVFLGGTDTTGVTIIWAMTALMKNPNAMKILQHEIRTILGRKNCVDEDDIEKLPYLKAVLKETLRLYPAIPLVPKETTATSIIDGYEIEPKTLAFVNIWAICRDPKYWDNPEEFMPERFLNNTVDYKGQDFGFIPFGSGRRICPGMHLGVAVMELALANLVYLFNWELPNGMTQEAIDTQSSIGLVLHKKTPLCLLAKPYILSSS